MSVEIRTQGIDMNLKRLAGKQKKAERTAVKEAAQYYANQLEESAPVYDGEKYKGTSRKAYMLEHMKDHVVISKFKDGLIQVGFEKEVSWRVHFTEFGTIKQRPNGFIERTQQSTQNDVFKIMEKAIKKELGL